MSMPCANVNASVHVGIKVGFVTFSPFFSAQSIYKNQLKICLAVLRKQTICFKILPGGNKYTPEAKVGP